MYKQFKCQSTSIAGRVGALFPPEAVIIDQHDNVFYTTVLNSNLDPLVLHVFLGDIAIVEGRCAMLITKCFF